MKTFVFIVLILIILALAGLCVWLLSQLHEESTEERRNQATIHRMNAEAYKKQVELLEKDYDRVLSDRDSLRIDKFFLDSQNRKLQDKLSAVLCPSNNHVWKDGRCSKCGKMENEKNI